MVHEDLAASVTSLGETCYSAGRVSVEVTTLTVHAGGVWWMVTYGKLNTQYTHVY